VHDIPLLVESGHWRTRLDGVLGGPPREHADRARHGAQRFSLREAVQAIIDAQATRAQRLATADWVIYNDDGVTIETSTHIPIKSLHGSAMMQTMAWLCACDRRMCTLTADSCAPRKPHKRDPVRISFNERLRTYLRLEQLYRRLRELLTRAHSGRSSFRPDHHLRDHGRGLRSDLRADVIKDLERQKHLLDVLRDNPDISSTCCTRWRARWRAALPPSMHRPARPARR
jgi:hypothetical protein